MALSGQISKIYERALRDAVEKAGNVMKQELIRAFKAQGHNNTGKAVKSIEEQILQSGDKVLVNILMNDYVNIVDTGVKASRIPYSPGSGRRRSKYIQALIKYFRSKGLGNESKSAAFATARKHKREGMPTRASRRFSQTGKRTGFLQVSASRSEERMQGEVTQFMEDVYTKTIVEIGRNAQKSA